MGPTRAAVVNLNFRAGSTLPVPVFTVPHGNWVNKAQTINMTGRCFRIDQSDFRLNLLLLKRQRCVPVL